MAREMALAGVDRSELTPPLPPQKPRTLIGKLQNFWYHYKFHTLIAVAIVSLAILLSYQIFSKNPADYDLVVVTETPLYVSEIDALKAYVAACGEDLDGDGNVEVSVENLNPKYAESNPVAVADQQNMQIYIATGEKMLFVFDRASYDGFAAKIADVTEEDYVFFGAVDTTASGYNADEHYWCWKDDARRNVDAFKETPEELLFAVRNPGAPIPNDRSQTIYEQGAALIKAIAESAE